MKKLLSFLLSLVLMSSLIFSDSGYAANESKYTNLGQTYITLDGTRYQTKAYKDANEDIYVSVSAIETLLGVNARSRFRVSGKPYGNLTKACSDAGMESFEYDDVLNYVYIWSEVLEDEFSADADLPRVEYYALGTPSDNRINFKHFFSILDKAVKNAAPEKLTEWRRLSEFKTLRYSRKNVCRMDAAMLVERLAAFLGNEYCDFNLDLGLVTPKLEDMNSAIESAKGKCVVENHSPYSYGGFENSQWALDSDWRGLSAHFVIGRKSLYSGDILFDIDEENRSIHFDEYITTKETMLAAARLLDSVDAAKSTFMKDINDPSMRHYNEKIITPEIVEFASDLPDVSDDNVPLWRGVNWIEPDEGKTIDADGFTEVVPMYSQWGFNSIRYYVPYTFLFSLDGSEVNEAELYRLDRIIAEAMKNKIHFELVFISLPGQNRDLSDNLFVENGDFELFTNPEKQEQARLIWEMLAERYADIPNSALTFYMLQEVTLPNVDVSTLYENIANVYMYLIEGIRKYDDDRFVIMEDATIGVNNTAYTENVAKVVYDKYDNVQISYCYVNTFVYYHMTIEEGEQIDNCPRSMFESEYPQKYYTLSQHITPADPMVMTGELPAGTTIDFGVWQIYTEEADFIITADGNTIYSEHISQPEGFSEYEVSAALSGCLPYRSSEKTISVTLEEDTDQIEFIIDGGEWDCINWSGMIVTLPEEYAVERVYRPSVYEFYLEHGRMPEGDEWSQLNPHLRKTSEIVIAPYGEDGFESSSHIIINPDVTFATDIVRDEASINAFIGWAADATNRGLGSITARIGGGVFSGNYYSCIRYSDDSMKGCDMYDIGWYTNDFDFNNNAYVPDSHSYALDGTWPDSKDVKYGDGWLRIDLVKSYIKHLDVIRIE